ncbi:transcription initiation protein SPT3 homolog [Nematostella vectensis]|uniref:transcription initiation protein SPT3 homolog n=1 Tax=Nematostella vectensis TaxID=45351 RepID=UPI0013903A5F|nr:transcription initiation protein SPT3 homolog [Nematostella vectensis]
MTKSKSKSKKADKQKDSAASVSSGKTGTPTTGEANPPPPSPSPVAVGTKNVPKVWFQTEIQSMMYAFGDCRRPSPESAAIIEEIVHQQIASLIVRAAEVTNMRGGRFMSIEDIIFLMRRDKDKLKRLIKYLSFKDMKSKTQKQVSQDEDDVLDNAATELKGSKRRKISYDFLSSIDHTGDLVSLFDDEDIDEVKQERNERAERFARTLDHQQYLDFVECRQANFNKKAGKFKEWLDCNSLIDMKPNTPVMEVFSYLAYETVAQVVDLALLVKKDSKGGDMLCMAMPPVSSQDELLLTSAASSPSHTPPGTPTTPTTSTVSFLPSPTPSSSSQGTSSTSKSKKKRKSKSSASTVVETSADCIQPWHIREAVRRYNHYMGPMAPYSPFFKPTAAHRTMCC